MTSASQAARDIRAGYGIISGVFESIVQFFRRLELYSEVSPTNEMKNIIAKMLVEVLSILAIATEMMEIKRSRMSVSLHKSNTSQLTESCYRKMVDEVDWEEVDWEAPYQGRSGEPR